MQIDTFASHWHPVRNRIRLPIASAALIALARCIRSVATPFASPFPSFHLAIIDSLHLRHAILSVYVFYVSRFSNSYLPLVPRFSDPITPSRSMIYEITSSTIPNAQTRESHSFFDIESMSCGQWN